MNWEEIKNQGYIKIHEKVFSVTHLLPTKYSVVTAETDMHPESQCSIQVIYSSHCVSRGPDKTKGEEAIRFDTRGEDYRITDNKNDRCFCEERYALSLYLPEVLRRRITDENGKFYFGKGTGFDVVNMNFPAQGRVYTAFCKVLKLKSHHDRLILVVMSAYQTDISMRASRDTRRPISARLLFGKLLRKEFIRKTNV